MRRLRPWLERLEDRCLLVTDLVSVGLPEIVYGNAVSHSVSINFDGRFVAFASEAANLVAGDTNGVTDIFVFDRRTGTTDRVSVASDGSETVGPFGGDGHSLEPSISANGRYVAFSSDAMNLTEEPWFWGSQIFVHDRYTGVTQRVSLNDAGEAADRAAVDPAISGDGRYVAFVSTARNLVPDDTNNATDVFVHDRRTGQTTRVSVDSDGAQANGSSFDISISANGRYVAFASTATNLVANDTNGVRDVFVHDRQTGETRRVNVDSDGNEANAFSQGWPSLSADGTQVAFMSAASNLAPDDTNNAWDVFVHDLNTGMTELVSLNSAGVQGNSDSHQPSISADGRRVAFTSLAGNLADDGIFNFFRADVFVHDRDSGVTSRVSLAHGGGAAEDSAEYPVISGDGRHVAFDSWSTNLSPGDENNVGDVFLRDLEAAATVAASTTTRSQAADERSSRPVISGEGRYIVFHSFAENLTTAETSGSDVFVRDMNANALAVASVRTDGTPIVAATEPEMSPDGRFVVFNGGNDLYLRDRETGTTTLVASSLGPFETASVSADGRFIAYYTWSSHQVDDDTNIAEDIFLRDMLTETTRRISVNDLGVEADDESYDPKISADGRYVAFESFATNLVPGDTNGESDIFVVDTIENTIRRVSVASDGAQGNGLSQAAAISAGGRYVAFHSTSSNLVPNDTNDAVDVFVHDLELGTTVRVSLNSAGNEGNFGSYSPSLSADGSVIAFDSDATNLVAGDTNFRADVFLHYLATGETKRISTSSAGVQGNQHSLEPDVSPDGLYVAYLSAATNLTPFSDSNGSWDVFRWHEQFDWGDAPSPYPTLQFTAGARHGASGPQLGAARDSENDGSPDAAAAADEGDDGVTFALGAAVSSVFPRAGQVTVNASGIGKLDAWIDFNQDGDWNDEGEWVFKRLTVAAGTNRLDFTIPAGAPAGDTYARFRLSSTGVSGPGGEAPDGEVEDHRLHLVDRSFVNLDNVLDVNADGVITSSDAVTLIDYLQFLIPDAEGNRQLPVAPPNAPLDPEGAGPGLALFLDVNGDGFLTAADAVRVIDMLHLQSADEPGDGESAAAGWLLVASAAEGEDRAAGIRVSAARSDREVGARDPGARFPHAAQAPVTEAGNVQRALRAGEHDSDSDARGDALQDLLEEWAAERRRLFSGPARRS